MMGTDPVSLGLHEIPAIPPVSTGPVVEDREPVLLWVHTGSATVEAGGSTYRLSAGEAVWVPPGVEHGTDTDPGSVVFPLFLWPSDRADGLGAVRVIVIPPEWEEWLIHLWDDNSYTRDTLSGASALLRVVAAAPDGVEGRSPAAVALPLPSSPAALGVARSLLRDPGSTRDVTAYAALEQVSGKTLQRRFLRETGMAFSVWRTRARIATAARRLAEGRDIGWTGRHVGYATPTGFTKAFRRHTGVTPREYAVRHRAEHREPSPPPSDRRDRLLAFADVPPAVAPIVPARAYWDLVNPFHALLWVYRGGVRVRIGTRRLSMRRGEAIWVPAGLTFTVEFEPGALMMTVGTADGRVDLDPSRLAVHRFPAEAEPFLLHTMLADCTRFHPASGQGGFVRSLFGAQFASDRAERDALTGALGEIAAALHRDPSDARSLADWARRERTTARALGATLMAQTGERFPGWRARIRMAAARELLMIGESPGQVFRQLGFASAATFTRAFTTAHGISPREYQRREARRAEIDG